MVVAHKIDKFLLKMFPNINLTDHNSIIRELEKFYTFTVFRPKVTIKDDLVYIDIDTPRIIAENSDYEKVVRLCENQRFSEAKPILLKLIKANPTNSEYHRILGQIHMENGKLEDAIDCLIDALRWNPTNTWALLLMGNILGRNKSDLDSAMLYYEQSLKLNPNDNIVLNNIGANLMERGLFKEAKVYLERALTIDDKYPNTYYALGLIAEKEGEDYKAFDNYLLAVSHNKRKDELFKNSMSALRQSGKKIIDTGIGKRVVDKLVRDLELRTETEIKLIYDNTISTVAKFEFAENYNRDHHVVRLKSEDEISKYDGSDHLIIHELVHLILASNARDTKANKLFITTNDTSKKFMEDMSQALFRLRQRGIPEDKIIDYAKAIYNGLMNQVYNAPLDLFVEDYIYKNFPELRPHQFFSVFKLNKDAHFAVTDKAIVEVSPKDVVSQSKTYNIVAALQFQELFGLDFKSQYISSNVEYKSALNFYEKYKNIKASYEPGREYELVSEWARELKLDKYFSIIPEDEYRNNEKKYSFIRDNTGTKSNLTEEEKEEKSRKFNESHSTDELNMAVVMYMVDALKYFKELKYDDIQIIAIEIAMLGIKGISPEKEGYKLTNIPSKIFTGYHLLAFYYVSWIIVFPEKVNSLNLPFDKEYEAAKSFARII